MNPLKKLAGQTAIYGFSSILGRTLNYLLTPLYTYKFVASQYGVVTELYAYVAFLVVCLTYGMETSFFRHVAQSEDKRSVYSSALLPILITSTLFMVLCSIGAQPIAELIQYPNHKEFVIWFAIIVGVDAISAIPLAKLRAENRAINFALVNFASIAVNIGLNLFFILYCKSVYDAGGHNWITEHLYNPNIGVGYIFISNMVASLTKVLLLLPQLLKINMKPDRAQQMKLIRYGYPLLFAGLAGIANETLDRILIKYMLWGTHGEEYTMAQLGIYGACYKVSILITLFIQAYRYAVEPFFFSKEKDDDAKASYALLMKYFILICTVMFLAIGLNLDYAMLFVGEEYRVGRHIVPILLLANIFLGVYYNLSVWFKLTNRTQYGAYIAGTGAMITVGLNIALIPIMGFTGSAWATLACYATMTGISYVLGRKYYPIPYGFLQLSIYLIPAAMIYVILEMVWPLDGWVKPVVNNAILLSFVTAVYLVEKQKKGLT